MLGDGVEWIPVRAHLSGGDERGGGKLPSCMEGGGDMCDNMCHRSSEVYLLAAWNASTLLYCRMVGCFLLLWLPIRCSWRDLSELCPCPPGQVDFYFGGPAYIIILVGVLSGEFLQRQYEVWGVV